MASKHLDELARLLGGQASARSSAQLPSLPEGPTVTVAGYGELHLPLTAARVKKLIALGAPAPFGKGEDTILDPAIRHTWHFPGTHVEVDWRGHLDGVLEEARSALGLPTSCRLEAQFHSLLVYERGQFFAPHQDSEKNDAMVASLVVVLPSPFSGGELVVHGKEGARRYAGSRTDTTLITYYADALHEVLPVRTGHRIALTYNLLMSGDTSQREAARDVVAEATTLITSYFTTVVTPRYGGAPRIPTRLAYLLDHSYTPRALAQGLGRLKGVDAERAAVLTAAAERSGCEVTLSLADVHEIRDDGSDDEYLIASDVSITRWLTPEGQVVEVNLGLDDDELAATTPSRSLRAYASEHEGYMGNYGNTIDRWYHRGALLVWPTHLAFANRAETAPARELRSLLIRLADRDHAAVARDLRGLLPTWPDIVRVARPSRALPWLGTAGDTGTTQVADLFGLSLALARFLEDEALGDELVAPFAIDDLRPETAGHLVGLADARGQVWTSARIPRWFTADPSWGHAALSQSWVERLPALCRELAPRPELAHMILEPTWSWLRRQIEPCLVAAPTSTVQKRLAGLGALLAAVLGGIGEVDDDVLRREVIEWCRDAEGSSIADLIVAALDTAESWDEDRTDRSRMRDLAPIATAILQARATTPAREPDDWSISAPSGCGCDLCEGLAVFLSDRGKRVLEWPLAKPKRQHLHHTIDAHEVPVTHTTRRVGRPYVLVLTKTAEVFDREDRARAESARDLRRIQASWP